MAVYKSKTHQAQLIRQIKDYLVKSSNPSGVELAAGVA